MYHGLVRVNEEHSSIIHKNLYSFLGMCVRVRSMSILASREHTCIHPKVSKSREKNEECKKLLDYADVSVGGREGWDGERWKEVGR